MRLLSLDYDPVYGKDTDRDTFSSDTSAFDYDVVIWDPAESYRYHYGYGERYKGLVLLEEGASVRIQADVARRQAEFLEFIDSGRVVVTIVRPPQECYIDTGGRTYSGTGRSRVTTRQVAPFDLLSAVPCDCSFTAMSGTRIDFDGDGPLVQVLRKYKKFLTYEAVISKPPGTTLAHIVGTDKVVASIQRSTGGGYLILLPAPDFEAKPADEEKEGKDEDEDEDEDEDSEDEENIWVAEAAEFQEDLLAAIEQLSGSASLSRPAWANRYATTEQLHLQTEVVKQQGRVEAARAKLAKLQRDKEAADARDQLFMGTGRALELEVRNVLQLIGGTVTEPAPGRDDWRVSFPEGNAVVEVKGVTKSAAEKHAAQLEKWVSSILEEEGEHYKGILAVNTWRDVPLTERTGDDFPPQMLPYCEGRGHCLVTGLQLFVIRHEVEKNVNRASYWRNQLLNTSGQLVGAEDWKSIIHEVKIEA
jgi:hypothetical protein